MAPCLCPTDTLSYRAGPQGGRQRTSIQGPAATVPSAFSSTHTHTHINRHIIPNTHSHCDTQKHTDWPPWSARLILVKAKPQLPEKVLTTNIIEILCFEIMTSSLSLSVCVKGLGFYTSYLVFAAFLTASNCLCHDVQVRLPECWTLYIRTRCERVVQQQWPGVEVTWLIDASHTEGQGFYTQELRREGWNRSMIQIKIPALQSPL